MKFRIAIIAVLALLAAASCKKETEKVYMNGTLNVSIDMPPYVSPGEKYTASASGVEAPDGTAVGYCFQNPSTKKYDTVAVYTLVIPEEIGDYSLYCSAFAVRCGCTVIIKRR